MTSQQNIIERIQDKLKRGLINAEEANIQMVEDLRFRVIRGKLSRDVRSALNKGIKDGRLERIKKDGLKPEAYYKTNFKHLAIEERNRIERNSKSALSGIVG